MRPARAIALLAALLLFAAGCGRGAAGRITESPRPDRPDVRVALVGATTGRSASSAIHALDGARLAFDQANEQGDLPVDVIAETFNTLEDAERATEIADEVAADPETIGVVAWSSTEDAAALAERLGAAGLPLVLVSPARPGFGHGGLRIVADDADQATAAASYIARRGYERACLAGDDGARSTELRRLLAGELRERGIVVAADEEVSADGPEYGPLVDRLSDAGCRLVFWSGGGTEAADLRLLMTASGLKGVRIMGADAMKSDAYLSAAGEAGYGTVASCPCVDVSTSAELEDQRFVQGYQSKYGGSPGAFAVEGWDAAGRFLEAIRAGNLDRGPIAQVLAETREFRGLAGAYEINRNGELVADSGDIVFYEDRRGQWVHARE